MRGAALALLVASFAAAQPKRVLYVTHSAGFRHDVLPVSTQVLRDLAARDGRLAVEATEDLSRLNAAALGSFDALLFYTSGELPLSDAQKRDLLEFVRGGKGFGGVHSATDTLYTWPEYGELIGARFNGHPWTQEVRIDIEDPAHPAASHLAPSFTILDEIYQFREFSRQRSRVLMTLDTASIDLNAPDVNPGTEDFPLAWCHPYGRGRVFYSALGHFESTWRDERFQRMLLQALLWLTGQVEADAAPRAPARPEVPPDGVGNSASMQPRATISPGSAISIFGRNLTTGSTLASDGLSPVLKLAGTVVKLDGRPVPLLYASPGQVNAVVPLELAPADTHNLEISAGGAGISVPVAAAQATPGIFAVTVQAANATIWATGLGPVDRSGEFQVTRLQPAVRIAGAPARVLFSGLAPGWLGLYQVNVELPANTPSPALAEVELSVPASM